MKNSLSLRKCFASFNDRNASTLLILLLLGDLFYFVLHTVNILTPPKNPLLHIGTDGGFAEYYQYIKFLWIILLLIHIAKKDASFRFFTWALLFIYFLADDSLQFHELGGKFIYLNFNFVPPFGIGLRDFGELAISAIAGLVFFVPLVLAYWSGSTKFRKISKDFFLLILVMLFFGIFIDSVNEMVAFDKVGRFVGGMLEDGGEMIAVSFILWYVFLLHVRETKSDNYLLDCLLGLFKKHST
jgi:hypothetical protein